MSDLRAEGFMPKTEAVKGSKGQYVRYDHQSAIIYVLNGRVREQRVPWHVQAHGCIMATLHTLLDALLGGETYSQKSVAMHSTIASTRTLLC